MSDSLNWIKNDEWFVSRLSLLRMETAGIETIRGANIKKGNMKKQSIANVAMFCFLCLC